MLLKAMREERTKLVAEMRAMLTLAETEKRDLSAEEIAAYDKKKADSDALRVKIERAEDLAAEEADLNSSRGSVGRRNGPERHARGPEAKTTFESLGEFMHAVRFNQNDQRLEFHEAAIAEGDLSAEQRLDDGASGGFALPPQFRPTIMRVPPQDALVRPRATVLEAGAPPDGPITMPALDQSGSNPANMFGGMQFAWIGEGDTKPDTGAKLKQFTLTPHEIAGTVTVTDKLLRNWTAASTFLEDLMRQGVAAAEDYAFIRGTGVNQPLGALNAGATYFVHRAQANTVTYVDLVNMVARVLMRGSNAPIWSIPQSVLPQIALMTDPEGHYIWVPNAAAAPQTGFAGTLLGYPVRWNNRAPNLGTKGDVLLADWSYYVIKDGSGPFVAASEHVLFTQNKTIIKIFWNVDGAPWLAAVSLLLIGCSTPYQEMGLLGGVSAARIDEHTVQIRAQGNGYTDVAKIQTFVMLRAAEETLKDGYDGFQIAGAQDATTVAVTPGVAVASGTAITYMPAMGVPMPGGIATIVMIRRGDPMWDQHHTYVAADVVKYLGPTLRKAG